MEMALVSQNFLSLNLSLCFVCVPILCVCLVCLSGRHTRHRHIGMVGT